MEDNKNIVSQNIDVEVLGKAFNSKEELKRIFKIRTGFSYYRQ